MTSSQLLITWANETLGTSTGIEGLAIGERDLMRNTYIWARRASIASILKVEASNDTTYSDLSV